MFTCDFVLQQTMINPSYNMQWYEIKKDGECYVLVPVPVGTNRVDRVVEVLDQLNRETYWGPDVGKEILE